MTLTFPTQAEVALATFRAATRTTSLARIAQQAGAEVEHDGTTQIYWFDDDTSLVVSGRGRAHHVEVRLP